MPEPIAEAVNEAEAVALVETEIAAEPQAEGEVAVSHEADSEAPLAQIEEARDSELMQVLAIPVPEQEPETEAVVEAIAAVEPALEAAPEEEPEDGPAPIEVHEEPIDEQAPPDEAEELPEVAQAVAVAAASPVEVADLIEPAGQIAEQTGHYAEEAGLYADEAEKNVALETAPEIEAAAEPVIPEPAFAEPVKSEESAPTVDSVPELAVSSVELKEPAIEEPPEPTAGQPSKDETESDYEATPLAEAEPGVEPAKEQVAEIDPEHANLSMELNEPIPEQTAEPTAASEVAPVAEEADGALHHIAVPEAAVPVAQAEAAPEEEAPAAEPEPAPAAQHKPFIKLETRDNEADLSPFSVVVSQVYDGPLDLLLDLIRKQDIDIYDIPIARITAQFLAYVNQLKATDVDVAGEFIYTASLLIHIKSKMLLPRAPAGPEDAAEDPRRELVERLLEHERFKNAAQMLQQKQMLEAATWTNPGLREFQDDASAEPEIAADTVDLVRIFRDILERARNRPVINVEEDSVTVGQMIQFLARRLTMEDKPVALRRLLSHTRSERALIAMFLALLELVRLQAILLRQDRAFSEIFIKKHTGFESVMNEGLANARDDWR